MEELVISLSSPILNLELKEEFCLCMLSSEQAAVL